MVWYKDAATVVALVAVVFSVASWWISMRHTKLQEQFSAHVDLRSVLQRLLTVPRDGQDIKARYKDDPIAYQIAYSTLQQELNVLASQGAKAVRLLKPDVITSPEYMIIGRAQMDAADYASYKRFIELAYNSATKPRDKVVAQCERAACLFQEGKAEEGRRQYSEALTILKDYPPFTAGAAVKLSITDSFQYQMQWAEFERDLAGNKQGALQIGEGLRAMVMELAPSTQHDAMAGVLADFLSVAAREIFESGDMQRGRNEFEATLQMADGLSTRELAVGFAVTMHLSWMHVEQEAPGNDAEVQKHLNAAIELVRDQPGTPLYQQVAEVASKNRE